MDRRLRQCVAHVSGDLLDRIIHPLVERSLDNRNSVERPMPSTPFDPVRIRRELDLGANTRQRTSRTWDSAS